MSAAKQVLGTTELLEMILLDLDINILPLSHRTCKKFNHTIADTNKLQRKFWFKADPNHASNLHHRGGNSAGFTINSLFCRYIPFQRETWRKGPALRTRVSEYSTWFHYLPPPPTHAVLEGTRDILHKKVGSWQRMILRNPQDENVDILWYCYQDHCGKRIRLRKEVTMSGPCTVKQFIADVRAAEEKEAYYTYW
ncbi:hypothetical protein DOTSEDRAFT_27571 [Dothistroma septosporum NZE10]|uniref:F-box domain-containing protein n=1 Tax=Dothistroma septosporum (strain NZE10 / CBS 128990) TaxID=675120 RepID=N1PI37_DOTSN|nr:hypothetical protein DOTSEDRAFT_27571 [Dothistroma septosporum NZE10]